MSDFAFFDIDGVLADDTHRQHYAAKKTAAGWTAYFGAMVNDSVHTEGIELVEWWQKAFPGSDFAYNTGRREDTEPVTRWWLDLYQFPSVPIFMRPFAERTPLALLKAGLVDIALEIYDTVWMFDDDPSVIKECGKRGRCRAVMCNWQGKPGHLVGSTVS